MCRDLRVCIRSYGSRHNMISAYVPFCSLHRVFQCQWLQQFVCAARNKFVHRYKHSPDKSHFFRTFVSFNYTLCNGAGRESSRQSEIMALRTLVNPQEMVLLCLAEVEVINHDTRRFRFRLPSSNHVLGVPVGQHLKLSAEINGELKSHSYTPVSLENEVGYVDFVIKIYFKNVHPEFPEGGKLTQYIESMKIGDSINFRGPMGRLKYLGCGNFSMKFTRKDDEEPVMVHANKLSMIAGGSGIAPMLQLIRSIVRTPEDKTKMSLLFANKSPDDIMLRKELDEIAKDHADRFKVWYTVDSAPKGWTYSTGFVNDEMIANHLYGPASDTLVLMCGPRPMIDLACLPALDKLNYDPQLRFKY